MCISLPARVLSLSGNTAEVEAGGSIRQVLVLFEKVCPGDWVLVHSGAALTRLSDAEAAETNRLLAILAGESG